MLSSSSTKKTKETSKTDKDVLLENSSLTNDKHSKEDQTISDVEKEYSRASSITADTMLFIVQNLDGTFFTLNVTPSDSVTNIKKMIKAKKGIDVYKYSLVFNDKELEDDKSVSDYDIQHESFIQMLPFVSRNVQFLVQNTAGNNIWISVGENESVKNLKSKIKDECKIPLDQQRFTCFDENTLLNGNFGMEEICDGIKEVRNDIAEIKSDLEKNFGSIENEFGALEIESAGTSDVNVQNNDFMGHESYHRDEDKMPVVLNSQNTASPSVEEDSDNDNDLIDECEESGANESGTEGEESDDYDQENDFDGQESYHGDEDETPADNTVLISDEDDDIPNLNDESGTEEAENEANNPLPPSLDPSINQTKIINAEDYQIVYKYFGVTLLKYLYVFDPVNRNLYYEYTWVKGGSDYACNRCHTRKSSKKQTRVSAKEIENNRIELRGPQHCCQKKEYNIVKKSDYERVKEESNFYARIFTTDDKSRYYDLPWNDGHLSRCSPCHHYHHIIVTANVIFLNDENGEKCLQMNRQHSCTPKTVQN